MDFDLLQWQPLLDSSPTLFLFGVVYCCAVRVERIPLAIFFLHLLVDSINYSVGIISDAVGVDNMFFHISFIEHAKLVNFIKIISQIDI